MSGFSQHFSYTSDHPCIVRALPEYALALHARGELVASLLDAWWDAIKDCFFGDGHQEGVAVEASRERDETQFGCQLHHCLKGVP
jgi:hypothetical protein